MARSQEKREMGQDGPLKLVCISCGKEFSVGAPDYRPFDAVCPWCISPNRILK